MFFFRFRVCSQTWHNQISKLNKNFVIIRPLFWHGSFYEWEAVLKFIETWVYLFLEIGTLHFHVFLFNTTVVTA